MWINRIAPGLVALVAVTALPLSPSAHPSPPVESVGQPAQPAPSLAWGTCPPAPSGVHRDPRQECATLTVPLDYAHPHGRTISIEVSRIPAAKQRRGVLLLNPGGPAMPGLDMPSTFGPSLASSVRDHEDLIGFDPRGVEYSSPQSCGLADPSLPDYFPYPAADGSIAGNVEQAKATARQCLSHVGNALRFFTTRNTARDMDQIRKALGMDTISYWGQSYGTYLGTTYANMYDRHVDRMVLEGNVDPSAHVWQDSTASWGQGMADRFPDAAAVAAAHNDTLGLGSTVAAVTDSYLDLAARIDKTPVPLPGTGTRLTGTLFRGVTYAMLLHNEQVPLLTQFWKATSDLADGRPTAQDATVLQQVLGGTDGLAPGVPADNQVTIFMALVCGDATWTGSVADYARDTAADRAAYPLTAGMPGNIWPCAYWPKPVERPVKVHDHGRRNILILQNRRDNATPWQGAVGLHHKLGHRSALVGVDNGGHYVYDSGSRCADTITTRFLDTGVLPRQDVSCTDVAPD